MKAPEHLQAGETYIAEAEDLYGSAQDSQSLQVAVIAVAHLLAAVALELGVPLISVPAAPPAPPSREGSSAGATPS